VEKTESAKQRRADVTPKRQRSQLSKNALEVAAVYLTGTSRLAMIACPAGLTAKSTS